MEWVCPWCGAVFDEASSDLDLTKDGKAMWCPDCDGLFFKNPEQDDHRRMLLLLEDRTKTSTSSNDRTVGTGGKVRKLRKRLSPLRYPGGKSRVIDQIFERVNHEKTETFVELFCGGASLGLSLLDAGVINTLVLNDMDPLVANFWKVATNSDSCGALIDFLEHRREPNMTDYWDAKESLIRKDEESSRLLCVDFSATHVTAAYGFLLLNRLSFGGILKANPICGKNGSDEDLRQRWNKKSLIKRLSRIRELSEHIQVFQMDALDMMQETVGWMEKATIFVDPPYTNVGKQLYRETFEGQHEDLADLLNEFYRSWPGPDIIITYDDCQMIRDLYPYSTVERLDTHWSLCRE